MTHGSLAPEGPTVEEQLTAAKERLATVEGRLSQLASALVTAHNEAARELWGISGIQQAELAVHPELKQTGGRDVDFRSGELYQGKKILGEFGAILLEHFTPPLEPTALNESPTDPIDDL